MRSAGRKPRVVISSTQKSLRLPRKRIIALINFLARSEGIELEEVDLAVVTSSQIAELNRRYRRRSEATDVLSFDLSDERDRGTVAQIVVSADAAVEHSAARGIAPQRELMLYIVHGLLHLCGYDDRSKSAAERMHAREEEILEAFLPRRGVKK